jgi:hypothetical protein
MEMLQLSTTYMSAVADINEKISEQILAIQQV